MLHARAVPIVPAVGAPPGMHIPDGFLSLPVALGLLVLGMALVGVASMRLSSDEDGRRVPLTGVLAAFIFAGQMINFPVAAGTSGHLLGGALAGILLGPWAGMLSMSAVVILQSLLFQDGGLLAIGANVVNMGLLTVAVGYGLYRPFAPRGRAVRLGVAGAAAWLATMAGALATALEIGLSGTAALSLVVPAMLSVHAVIGLGEAAVTVAALSFIGRVQPSLLGTGPVRDRGGRAWVPVGLAITLAVLLLAPVASRDPDGLERVAESLGFAAAARTAGIGPLPEYALPGLSGGGSTIAAGAVGVAAVALVGAVVVRAAQRRRPPA